MRGRLRLRYCAICAAVYVVSQGVRVPARCLISAASSGEANPRKTPGHQTKAPHSPDREERTFSRPHRRENFAAAATPGRAGRTDADTDGRGRVRGEHMAAKPG